MTWLANYAGRKAIYLKVNYDPVTDYPTKILVGESSTATGTSVNCEALTSTLFEDMRFTLEDGETQVSYWIESITGISPNRIATVWIKVNVGLLDTKFYLYYGNPIATDNSDSSIFEFFDHFSGSSIDTNKWFQWIGSGNISVSNSEATISGIDTSTYNAWGAKQQYGTNYAFRALSKVNSETIGSDVCPFGIEDRSATGNYLGTNICQAVIQSSTSSKQYSNRGNSTTSTVRSDVMTSYVVVEIQRNSTTNIRFYWNNVLKATHTTNLPVDNMGISFYTTHSGAAITVDWCLVRKYSVNEPSIVNSDSHEENYQWLKGWTYRRRLKIKAPTTKVNDVPIKYLVGEIPGLSNANMDCAGEGLPSFNDLRFTEDDGQTLIPHYIETITGTTPNQIATTWIRPSYINTDNTTFFMYFGNPGAPSTSSSGTTFSGTSIGMVDYTQKVLTTYGNATVTSAQKKLGDSSIYFDGTGDYLTVPDSTDWDFGSGDFSIDFWVLFNSLSVYNSIVTKDSDGQRCWMVATDTANNKIFFAIPTVTLTYNDTVLSTGIWYHVYFGRTNNVLYSAINGTIQSGSYTFTIPTATNSLNIGRQGSYGNYSNIYFDELRISKGIARWTSNFTPPTQQYTPDQYTVLLLRGNNYWLPTTFYDESGYGFAKPVLSSVGVVTNEVDKYTKLLIHGHKYMGVVDSATEKTITTVGSVAITTMANTITVFGNSKISTDSKAFGNSSGYFDGYGDFLRVPVNIFAFGRSDFTIDFWINCTAASATNSWPYIMASSYYLDPGFGMYIFGPGTGWGGTATLQFGFNNPISLSLVSTSLFRNTGWKHVAIVRNNLTAYMFVNGIIESTITLPINANLISTESDIMGASNSTTANEQGYIQELRISRGIARWTENFTPSTTQYTPDQYTVLLLHFDGINNSTTFIDDAYMKVPYSVKFPGNSNYLTLGASKDWNLGYGDEPYTVDFWYKFNIVNPNGENQHLIVFYGSSTSNFTFDNYNSNYTNRPSLYAEGISSQWPFYPQVGVWYHFAIVRENRYYHKIYIGGVLCGFSTSEYSVPQNITTMFIGSWYNGDDALYGYISEFRISKGIARWTKNFTPPTGPYLTPSVIPNTTTYLPLRGRNRY